MTENPIPPRDEEDPRERDLARRSGTPAVGVWLILFGLLLLGLVVYGLSAVL
ncbi:hypothetical protein [Brevundimonas aurifodinae]|uniref:Uncharacterized protein n=1 Tax=Brevundimonas aurifodinae TaxID=1508312 RepID=A0ABV1NRU0_9CAUL